MKKIKILYILSSISNNGINAIVSDIYERINHEEFQIDFCVKKTYDCKYLEIFKKYDSKIFEYSSANRLKSIKKEYEIIKNGEYDLVHIHATGNVRAFVLHAYLAHKAKVKKVILHAHNSSMGTDKKLSLIKQIEFRMLKPLLKGLVDYYFSCSKKAAEWSFPKSIYKQEAFEIIYNGIDTTKFGFEKNKREAKRKELHLEDKLVLGHVGRFVYQKNHEFLLEVFKEVLKLQPNSGLLLIGEGPLYEAMRDKVKALEIEDKVEFLGVRSDVSELMCAMDAFLLPSFFEGLGIVAIEAQAVGAYTLVSEEVPKEAKITDNITYLSLKLSARDWAQKIVAKDYNYNREKYQGIVNNSEYNILKVVNKLENFYRKLEKEVEHEKN